jgi:hypothetical protein
MLLMAKASIAVLLSFMGEAPLLSFYAGFFGLAGYWFRTHSHIANVCKKPDRRISAKRLREGIDSPLSVAANRLG